MRFKQESYVPYVYDAVMEVALSIKRYIAVRSTFYRNLVFRAGRVRLARLSRLRLQEHYIQWADAAELLQRAQNRWVLIPICVSERVVFS